MNVGDLYWVEFPQGAGRALAGRRPAAVVQTAEATLRLSTHPMVPLTSQLDVLRFPGTVLIEPDRASNLRRPSVALVFQLAAIDRRFVASRLGRASEAILEAIWFTLDELTGRSSPASPERHN
ncbi:MAG: type II toxin-antitoxin system PemK/MazF family toxin [Phycisphaerales bacterium]|nr:type II toxin-antitoxin system PemK/MazF family toxin [Phycisphaerales bacterium]